MKKLITFLFFVVCLLCSSMQTALCQNLDDVDELAIFIQEEESKPEIVRFPDVRAEFPGGMPALMKFLAENFNFPIDPSIEGWHSTIIIEFIVRADGSIDDVKVVKKVPPSLEKEAIRLIKAMPKWTPGTVNGENVASYFQLPIHIKPEIRKSDENVQDVK
ncbi:MAG: energy transducer TonB [Bacteroidetes bacterium]|nr:energy transducer TonB [Bacteroidota bacterium]